MPVTYSGGAHHQPVSCVDRMKNAAKIGFLVGCGSGLIFGGLQSLRLGYRGAPLFKMVGKSMVQAGVTFGTFIVIGTGIRC